MLTSFFERKTQQPVCVYKEEIKIKRIGYSEDFPHKVLSSIQVVQVFAPHYVNKQAKFIVLKLINNLQLKQYVIIVNEPISQHKSKNSFDKLASNSLIYVL